ncbi:hypothetical protein BLA50215_05712 [Burkholderia lata]|nr:hypothetical protein [Burkholderia lata]VWD45517.1 hypothetical protein BLA50215_05712 [Burkholderia lata]
MSALILVATRIHSGSRDWHPLVALAVLYLIASAVAPEFGV